MRSHSRRAFTLIELSIVLVIIGLLVGGVLVGNDLIKSAEVRAEITQIEKYNTAVNTFRAKFNALPGDINATDAAQFGFLARNGQQGQGDGNGIIEGYGGCCAPNGASGTFQANGEVGYFWEDLTTIHLIEGNFSTANVVSWPQTHAEIPFLMPNSKLSRDASVFVYSAQGTNYFEVQYVYAAFGTGLWAGGSAPGVTVKEAYNIDKKMDDGLPQTGNVTATVLNGNLQWAAGGGAVGANPGVSATPSATTCYDNGGNASASMAYSITQNNGAGVNCALSFKFQ